VVRLFIVLLGFAIAPAAHAQPQAVPTSPLVGDGATPATLQILTPPGARPRATATAGTVGTPEPIPGGYLIPYVPPNVAERTTHSVTVRLRGGGVSEDLIIPVEIVPGWQGSFTLQPEDASLNAAQSTTVKVRPSTPGPAVASRTLRAAASHGTLSGLVPSTDGTWSVRYTAPTKLDNPGFAVFVVSDTSAPSTFVSASYVPLTSHRTLTFDAAADHTAVLRVGDREFGPKKVSPAGKVSFQVDLLPTQREGHLTIAGGGSPSSRSVELPFEPTPGIAVGWMPERAGGGTTVFVPVACRTARGAVCTATDAQFEASAGTVGVPDPRGDLLLVPWTLPEQGFATLSARIGDMSASTRLETTPGPVTVKVSARPDTLTADQQEVALTAAVKDPTGRSVPGRPPVFDVVHGQSVATVADAGDGTYTGTWRVDADAPWVEATARTPLRPTGLPAHRLIAWPATDVIPAGAPGTISLYVAAEDAFGMPVPDVSIDLAVPVGDASTAPSARTDNTGVARVDLRVGRQPGLVVVAVSGAGLKTSARLWQASSERATPTLVATGSAPDVEALERWRGRVGTLYVSRGTPITAAPAMTSPIASPTTTGTPAARAPAARAPKPAPSTDRALARLRGALSNAPLSYRSERDGDDAFTYAPQAAFGTAPIFGHTAAHVDVEVWPDTHRRVGLDLRARAGVYRIALGSAKRAVAPIEIEIGGRYRAWDAGRWSAYAGGGLGRLQGLVIAYTDETRSSAKPVNFSVFGARTGGGLRYESGPLMLELDVQAFWTPVPNVVRSELRADVPLVDALALTLALGGDARFVRYRVPDSESRIRTRQLGLDVRAGVALPFF
jgi:hypothetical protein